MATLTFDKLAYVDRLKAAGMGEREARALAEGLDQALREVVAARTDRTAVRTDLSTEIMALKAELKADIATLHHVLHVEIQALKRDVLRWMVGVAFAQAGITAALIRFMPH